MRVEDLTKLILIFMIILIAGCSSVKLSNLELESSEAIIIGNMKIINNQEIYTKKWNLLFDERLTGKYGIFPDKEGYVFMKLPLGKHFISLLSAYPNNINLPDNYISITLNESGIYYIGDITFYWDISNGYTASGGLAGVISDSKNTGLAIKIDIENNCESTSQVFNDRFQNINKIKSNIMQLDEKLYQRLLDAEKIELSKLEKITLNNGKSMIGNIVSLKKGILYVTYKSTLFEINYKRVRSITQNGSDTLLNIDEFKDKKINYNKFSEFDKFE